MFAVYCVNRDVKSLIKQIRNKSSDKVLSNCYPVNANENYTAKAYENRRITRLSFSHSVIVVFDCGLCLYKQTTRKWTSIFTFVASQHM